MKTIRCIFAAAAMIVFSFSTFSQVTATGHISVTIVSPISIVKVQDMNFGHVSVESGSGSVTLSPENKVRSASGAVELMDGTEEVSLASFRVKGSAGATFSITLPDEPVLLSNGNKSMTGLGTDEIDLTASCVLILFA